MDFATLLGYFASVIVLLGMMMNSVRLLRWLNLAGATMFAIYGFLIKALPVGILNSLIAAVDIYYLLKMYFHKEFFRTITVRGNNYYLKEFLKFYNSDIKKFFPSFEYKPHLNKYTFFVLRDMNVAGIVMGREYSEHILKISLDYTVPQYRDFKVGRFIYKEYSKKFAQDGYNKIVIFPETKSVEKYLKKMGFKKAQLDNKNCYMLDIKKLNDEIQNS